MHNKEYVKAFLYDNGVPREDKDKVIGEILGEELIKYIECLFPSHKEIQRIAIQKVPDTLTQWVKDKFKDITKRDPNDYDFEVMTRTDFTRPSNVGWVVRLAKKPFHERAMRWSGGVHTFTDGTRVIDGSIDVTGITADSINTSHITAQSIQTEPLPSFTLTTGGITYHDVQPIRVVERYGPGIINTNGSAVIANNVRFRARPVGQNVQRIPVHYTAGNNIDYAVDIGGPINEQ